MILWITYHEWQSLSIKSDKFSNTGLSLQANVSKPNFGTLQVELRPNESFPGELTSQRWRYRSVYILNDGRVDVF